MTMACATLATLHATDIPAHAIIAIDASHHYSGADFLSSIHATRETIIAHNHKDWALYHNDSYQFLIGLFSLLSLNKTVYLPGNNTQTTVEKLTLLKLEFLGEFPVKASVGISTAKGENTGDFKLNGEIVVFTSGSSGAAKSIKKTLPQLDQEIHALESLWGTMLKDATVLSTVSHQHIYGLLFKVLWPFCAGRPFVSKTYRDPARLIQDTKLYNRSIWIGSPAHLNRCDESWAWDIARHCLAALFSSGGPLALSAAKKIRTLYNNTPFEVFGSSETGGIAWRQQLHSVYWQTFAPVKIKTNTHGALLVKSPYLESSQWLTTADAVKILADGTFELGLRLDRIVKIEEKRVSLAEIEQQLNQHEWLNKSYVLTISQQRTALAAAACLSDLGCKALKRQGKHLFTRAIKTYLSKTFEATVIPRYWRFPSTLPINSQGKIMQEKVKQLFETSAPPTLYPEITKHVTVDNAHHLSLEITPNIRYFSGHFPTKPILAGVVQIKWAEHFARKHQLISGTFLRMETIKFKRIIVPNTKILLQLTPLLNPEKNLAKLHFIFSSEAGEHSSGKLVYSIL